MKQEGKRVARLNVSKEAVILMVNRPDTTQPHRKHMSRLTSNGQPSNFSQAPVSTTFLKRPSCPLASLSSMVSIVGGKAKDPFATARSDDQNGERYGDV